jgi:hypothetical protein
MAQGTGPEFKSQYNKEQQTKTRWRKIIKLRAAIHCRENRKTLEKTKEAKTPKTWKTKNRRHKLQEPEMKQSLQSWQSSQYQEDNKEKYKY